MTAPNASMPAAAQPVVNIGKTGSMQFFMVAQNQAVVHVAGAEFNGDGAGCQSGDVHGEGQRSHGWRSDARCGAPEGNDAGHVPGLHDGSAWELWRRRADVPRSGRHRQITIPFDGTYSICSVTPPAGYVFAAANPGCTSFQVKQGSATVIANTIVTPIASLIWRVTDGTTDANNQPTLLGPSTFKVRPR